MINYDHHKKGAKILTIIVLITPIIVFKFFDYLAKEAQPEVMAERREEDRLKKVVSRAVARL